MKGKEARMAAVVRGHDEGLTVKELAEKHDLSINTVREYLRLNTIDHVSGYHRKRMEESEERTESMVQEYAEGLPIREIADRHGVSCSSVQQSLQHHRMDGADPDAIYKVLTCTAQDGRYIRGWASRQAGRTLMTPDGEMTVAELYPNIMLCIARRNKRIVSTTFTNGQLFYMNGGR